MAVAKTFPLQTLASSTLELTLAVLPSPQGPVGRRLADFWIF